MAGVGDSSSASRALSHSTRWMLASRDIKSACPSWLGGMSSQGVSANTGARSGATKADH